VATENSITESALRILDVLVQRGAVAGHAIMVRELAQASGLPATDFDRADTYLIEARYIEGTMGRDGMRCLTPAGIEFHQSNQRAVKNHAIAHGLAGYELTAVFTFGVIFVVVLLILAIVFPHPTPFQYLVFRIVLALAASGIAALVPGFIEVNVSKWLRAGGAIAIFVLVYFFSPADLVTEPARSTKEDSEIVQLALGYSRAGRHAQALVTLKSLIDRSPNDHLLQYRYGTILRLASRKTDAVQHLEEAKRIKPDHMPTRMNLAWAYNDLNLTENAKAEAKWVAQNHPLHSDARFLLAYYAYEEGQYMKAKEYYDQIIKADGDGVAHALVYLAETLLTEQQSPENKTKAFDLIVQAFARVGTENNISDGERLVRKVWCDSSSSEKPLYVLRANAKFTALLDRYNASSMGGCLPATQ